MNARDSCMKKNGIKVVTQFKLIFRLVWCFSLKGNSNAHSDFPICCHAFNAGDWIDNTVLAFTVTAIDDIRTWFEF